MKTSWIAAGECPYCGAKLEGHIAVEPPDASPEPGDYTVCLECSILLVFTEDMGVRLPTLAELDKAESQRSVRFAVEVTRRVREER